MKKKKALIVATVVKTHVAAFHLPYLRLLQEMGYETAVAARNDYENPADCRILYCDTYYDVPFARSPVDKNNIRAYKQLQRIMNTEKFDLIHCHTPVGGVLGRLCARKHRKSGTSVFYTAHGFHFYKGAPFKNWLLYYPIEKLCAHFTDTLITINQEDYLLAQKKMKARRVVHVSGVGIDLEHFQTTKINRVEKRREIGVPEDAIMLLSVGELSTRKNHEVIIKALSEVSVPNVHYCIAGRGPKADCLKELVSALNVTEQVHFLGFRSDISALCNIADVFCFPSFQEGLPVALMEAMASGLPVIASDIRGNNDCCISGFTVPPKDAAGFSKAIATLAASRELREEMGVYNREQVEMLSLPNILTQVRRLYEDM